jgi:formylglycine-generating enzyme
MDGYELCYDTFTWDCNFSSNGYRLPTEAEWEFAAQGGINNDSFVYSGSNNITDVGWYSGNSGGETHQVRELMPNSLDIYDMSGNVYEWCNDWYADDYYWFAETYDPPGPSTGAFKVFRGGSWNTENCLNTKRSYSSPLGSNGYGFRMVRVH